MSLWAGCLVGASGSRGVGRCSGRWDGMPCNVHAGLWELVGDGRVVEVVLAVPVPGR